MIGIYTASRTRHTAKWQALRAAGHNIISTWIDEAGENETDSFHELWTRIGEEVRACGMLVLYLEPEDFPAKGALVEVGMAMALGTVLLRTPASAN